MELLRLQSAGQPLQLELSSLEEQRAALFTQRNRNDAHARNLEVELEMLRVQEEVLEREVKGLDITDDDA